VYRCSPASTDAALLDIFGFQTGIEYEDLSSYLKKYVTFAVSQHTDEFPLLPLYPVRLFSLITYAWWLQFKGVAGGFNSIRNYLTAVTEANSAAGHPHPAEAEPWTWRKFRSNVPKHLLVVAAPKKKWRLHASHLQAIALDADFSSAEDISDLSSYAVAWFSAIRVGHFAPKSKSALHTQHLLRWHHIAFLPSIQDPQRVFIKIDSTKTRNAKKVDPWWTAYDRNDVFPQFCGVRLLLAHYQASYTGEPSAYVWRSSSGGPQLRSTFTERLRQRLLRAAPRLGLTADTMDVKAYSAISFRKGALSALAGFLPPVMLAKVADHRSVETTNTHYVEDSLEQRAANTAASSRAFAPL
jgi:hypothetical protein